MELECFHEKFIPHQVHRGVDDKRAGKAAADKDGNASGSRLLLGQNTRNPAECYEIQDSGGQVPSSIQVRTNWGQEWHCQIHRGPKKREGIKTRNAAKNENATARINISDVFIVGL
jgi:hypothetical protein